MGDDFNNDQHGGVGNEPEGRSRNGSSAPEPPVGWKDASGDQADVQRGTGAQDQAGGSSVPAGADSGIVQKLESARKMNIAAQIVAIVSLFIGGVLASTVAVVLAVVSYRQLAEVSRSVQQPSLERDLKRAGVIAIVLSVAALVLNAVALIFLLPEAMRIVQTGDYSSLFGGTAAGPSTGSSSTWG